ncbi:unnamed protein product, partial [Brenthis ino]
MRAVYVLLCLALARNAVCNIVRHQYNPRVDTLVVHPNDYADQVQREREVKMTHHHESVSQESKEQFSYDDVGDYPTSFRSVKNWNVPVFSTVVTQSDQVPYGDVIEWRGVQIAVGPNSPVSETKEIERIFRDAYKTIQHVSEEDKKKIHDLFQYNGGKYEEDSHYNATQLIRKYHYGVEEHVVKTDDGYFLTLFRIKAKQDSFEVTKRPVVFLMHGVLGSADEWLLMGPEYSLAYLLTDAGYDVWLGNVRGNKYSRRHVTKHVSNPDFWQFSIDEIALMDLPVMIDYALKVSEQKKLIYIGHSQGSTIFFALAATHPEYREKITMMFALSPMVYMTNVRSPLFRMIAPSSQFYERLYDGIGHEEFQPSKELVHTIGGNICDWEIGCKHICSNIYFVMAGVDTAGMDFDLIPSIASHLPAGASTRQIFHYGQGVASQEFRKFNYGVDINKKIYGQNVPPKYNMSEVDVPVVLYFSEEDWLAHPKDVERLHRELPNVKEVYEVPEQHFSTMDFQFSKKAPEIVYKRLIESIKNYY